MNNSLCSLMSQVFFFFLDKLGMSGELSRVSTLERQLEF